MIKHVAGKKGWSKWISPSLNQPYRIGCCDCGLVHDIQFRVMRKTKRVGKGWTGERAKGMKVLFRAKRNNRSTAQLRRRKP